LIDACSRCPAPCCQHYEVTVDGYDLFRLVRGLMLPWRALVELVEHPGAAARGFYLDTGEGARCYGFRLRQRPGGACQLLLELAEGHRRCGAHALRLIASDDEPYGSWVWGMALCPDDSRARFTRALPLLRPLVDEDLAEGQLYFRVLQRWNRAAAGHDVDQYVAWLLDLYGAIEPLRRGERGEWQLLAYRLIAEFPLPAAPVSL
jgi:hypothetical protein